MIPQNRMTIDELAVFLEGKKLSFLEEARALSLIKPHRKSLHGLSLREIAVYLGHSYDWVHKRMVLLKLPADVQKATEDGLFMPSDINTVCTLPKERWRAAARRIVRERKEGLQPTIEDLKHHVTRPSITAVKKMVTFLIDSGIEDLSPRILMWSLGKVSTKDMHKEIEYVASH